MIKRFTLMSGALVESFNTFDGAPTGEWVRYADIKPLLLTFDSGVAAAAAKLESAIEGMADHRNPDGMRTGEDFYEVELAILRSVLKEVKESRSGDAERP